MDDSDTVENALPEDEPSKRDKALLDKQKSKLKQQIKQLKSIILQMEWSLDTLRFGNTKCAIPSGDTNASSGDKITDASIQLETELYKYSGFSCVKFSKQEYVFNFSSLHKYDKRHIFAIQILSNDDKGKLGKWIMPMSVDLNKLVPEFSIRELKNVPCFLRTCKHYIDCYFIRQEQYIALMDVVSHIKNCNLQTDAGYTQITLYLMDIHDKDKDLYINIAVYLLYNANEARPYKVEINSTTKKELDKNSRKCLQTSLACFKKYDLRVAFGTILNGDRFEWIKQDDDEDDPLEINTLSDSDEAGFLEDFSFLQQKSLTVQKESAGAKRKRKKKQNYDIADTSRHSKKSISLQRKKQKKNVGSHSEVQQITIKEMLKQTQATTCKQTVKHKPYTSTPIHSNKQQFSKDNVSDDIDVSDIVPVNKNLSIT